MTISYPLTMPDQRIARIEISQHNAVGLSQSPFSGEQQIYQHQGQWWRATVSLPPLRRGEAEPWIAFLTALMGRRGTFLMGDPARRKPRGSWAGTPVVDGAGQSGQTLALRGFTPNQSGVAKAGDYLQLGSSSTTRLHMVLLDAASDANGKAVLNIWPRLRESPADGASLVVFDAQGQWRLDAPGAQWVWVPGPWVEGLTFSAVEAL